MTKKFTEEQYQKIIKAWGSEAGYVKGIQAVVDYLASIDMSFMVGEAVALANPRTREWAHDNFVEKENKYYWKLNGLYLVKSASDGSLYFDGLEDADSLSESEIHEWGFNPEMFDKYEV